MPSVLAIDGNVSHDGSVTVIRDGEVFAVECERLDRVKKSQGFDFRVEHTPEGPRYEVFDMGNFAPAIRYCLELAGLERVDHIIHTHAYKFVRFLRLERYLKPGGRIQRFPSHHLAHACSAFYYSDFDEAAVLVVDGSGPEAGNRQGILQSLYHFDGKQISVIKRTFATERFQLGIGLNYYMHTHLLGMEEGSIMGLSSYGDHTRYAEDMLCNVDGHIYVNPDRIPHRVTTSTAEVTETSLYRAYGIANQEEVARARERIEHGFLADIAAKLQHETETRMIELARELSDATGCANLCMGGGVTLNSVANHKILEHTPFENIFIQPGAHDAGISLGLALFAHHHTDRQPRRRRSNVFLGRAYSNDEIEETLQRYATSVVADKQDDIVQCTARMLADQEVVAWFQGRLEFGPRALGHRSILADPRSLEVRDRVNDIKQRERWRPLGPAVLGDRLADYFQMLNANPYMLLVADVTERARQEAPGIVHVDGTARPQSVEPKGNPILHRLISEFDRLTGMPMLINTSLNTKGQPLIEHPEQAVLFLLNSSVDALVIGDWVVRRDERFEGKIDLQLTVFPEVTSPIDTLACVAELDGRMPGLQLTALEFVKGSYHVVLERGVGESARTLDLSIDVDGRRIANVVNNRSGKSLADKHRPLIAPFVEAFERYLADSATAPGQR